MGLVTGHCGAGLGELWALTMGRSGEAGLAAAGMGGGERAPRRGSGGAVEGLRGRGWMYF